MREADVVFSWLSTASVAKEAFERPTKFVQMPAVPGQKYDQALADMARNMSLSNAPLLALLKRYAPDVRPLRVALVGFSEGCQGVRSVLRSSDGRRVDSAIAIDGIHAQFQEGSATRLQVGYVTAWAAFARMAAAGGRLFVDTASSIVPPYPRVSTTATADWIWREATGATDVRQDHPLPEGFFQTYDPPLIYPAGSKGELTWPETRYGATPLSKIRNIGSCWILNYKNLDPTGHNDHVFQAEHVLHEVLVSLLAKRWNALSPEAGICSMVSGPDGPEACFPPTKLSDFFLTGHADPAALDVNLAADPTIPTPTEAMPPAPQEEITSSRHDALGTFVKWGGGILAASLFAAGATKVYHHLKKNPPALRR